MLALLFTLIVLLEVVALYSIKEYSVSQRKFLIPIFIGCYAVIPIFLALILREKQNISTVNIIWNIITTICGLAIGIFVYSEKITLVQFYGICLGTFGLILML
jgi:multidrug transporter EmrE-like cation transporter